MPDRTFDAFLFDMDGTLIDSIEAAERVWAGWARRKGLDVATFLPTIHGSRAVDTIGRLGLPGLDPAYEAKEVEREEIVDLDGIVPIVGATDFLAQLPADRWTIVTSAPRALALARLGKVGIKPPAKMVTGEDIKHGKPAPDCYLLGAERLGFDISRCVVFEDAPVGILSGEASGASLVVIGATHRHRATDPLLAIDTYEEADLTVSDSGLALSRR